MKEGVADEVRQKERAEAKARKDEQDKRKEELQHKLSEHNAAMASHKAEARKIVAELDALG